MTKVSTQEIFLNKYWRLILVVLIILILLFGYAFLLSKDLSLWRELGSQQTLAAKDQLEQSKKELEHLMAVQAEYDQLAGSQQQRLARLSQILPTAADLPQLVLQLEALAKQSGFETTGVSFSSDQVLAGSSDQRLRSINVSLNIAGPTDYISLKKLLSNLEQHIRLLDLLSLGVSAQSEVTKTGGSYSLQLRTYYWQQ